MQLNIPLIKKYFGYTECPQKKRRVHNSLIYRRILIIYIHQIKWFLIGYKTA
jgi:hypothetical protein